MSIVNEQGLKIVLPRLDREYLWDVIHEKYTSGNRLHWKYLAMLSLQINSGWSLEHIGLAFGHPKGHVARCIDKVKKEIHTRFKDSGNKIFFEQPETGLTPQERNPHWETEPVSHSTET